MQSVNETKSRMRRHSEKLSFSKWIFSLFISPGMLFLFAYTAIYIAIQFFLTAYIKSKYSESAFFNHERKCVFKFEDISINPWLNELTIKNCAFSFDLPSTGGTAHTAIRVQGQTSEIKLRDFTLLSLLREQTITIQALEVAKTKLSFLKSEQPALASAAPKRANRSPFYFFPDSLAFSLEAKNLRVRINSSDENTVPKLDVTAGELLGKVYPTTWTSFDQQFLLSSGHATYRHSDRSFALNTLALAPNTEVLKGKYPIEEFRVSLKRIELNETNPLELFFNHGVIARSINATGLNVTIKANWQDFVINQDVLLPNEAFQQLPFDVAIDSVNIYDSEVNYSVFCHTQKVDKHIRFSALNARLTEIYKANFRGIKNLPCHFSASCLLMGKTPFEVEATLPLLHPNFNVHFHGKIGKLPASSLKLIANPKYAFTATRQSLDRIAFDVKINNGTAMGWVNAICGGDAPNVQMPNSRRQYLTQNKSHSQIGLPKELPLGKNTRAGIIQARYSKHQGFLQFMWETIWDGLSQIFTA